MSWNQVVSDQKKSEIVALGKQGLTHSEIAAIAGVHKKTVAAYLRHEDRPPCACGRAAGHKGWCPPRIERRPAWRANMDKLKARWRTPERDELLKQLWVTKMPRAKIVALLNELPGDPVSSDQARSVARRRRLPNGFANSQRNASKHKASVTPAPIEETRPAPLKSSSKPGFSMAAMAIRDPRIDTVLKNAESGRRGNISGDGDILPLTSVYRR